MVMYKTGTAWWVELPKTKSGSPKVVGRNGNVRYCTEECGYIYGKANCGLSTDVENAAIGYPLACKHKIHKWLNNLVCSKQNSVDQSSKDFNHH